MKHLRLVSLLIFFFQLLTVIVRPQDEPRAAWQVLRYEINATLPSATAAERTLAARAVLSLRNIGQGAGRTLTTRINPAVEVISVSVGEQPARFLMRDESRTRLRTAIITLPAAIAPGQTMSAAIEYKLLVTENTGTAAVSVEGSQFLPLASWYPTPNSPFSPRGTDTAPVLLKVNAPGGETVISSGQMSANGTFEQKLFAQPFFLTGKWETIEGAGDTRGVSAYLLNGATLGEK
ncbi:MAG: hypothetical protein M3Q76_04840, partial [Acidobacteriota bacterium]|nr:hypothetical protein [Acidobacteriota bacterium]